MSPELVIIGNTNTHIWQQDRISETITYKTAEFLSKKVFLDYDKEQTIIAGVVPSAVDSFVRAYKVTFRDINVGLGVRTIENIGIDRLLNCQALINDLSEFMVVDLGTAISISIVKEQIFIGGFILPGINTAARALARDTALLEAVDVQQPSGFEITADTLKAINDGIYWGSLGAVKELYSRSFQDQQAALIMTGGNAGYFVDQMQDLPNFSYQKDLQQKGLEIVAKKLSAK